MKQGWKIKKLSDICQFKGGYTPSKSLLYTEGDIPYFKVSDMNNLGNSRELIHTELYLRGVNRTYPAGSVVFPKNGGAILTNKKRLLVMDSVVDLNTGVAIPNKLVNKDYFYYFFSSIDFHNFVKEGTLPVLKIKEISELSLYVPDLSEQQRIVNILDREFARIDALKANAIKSYHLARELFQSALKKELQPKEGWKEFLFEEIGEYQKEQGQYPHLNYIGMENIESSTGRILGVQKGSDIKSNSFRFKQGYVMYGRLRPYLKKVFVADFDGCCSTEVFPISTKGILPHLLKYWFLSDEITDKINATCAGCRMPRANMNEVKKIKIYIPDIEKQRDIICRLDKLNESCRELKRNYLRIGALCEDMKQALLRKAFNGEL